MKRIATLVIFAFMAYATHAQLAINEVSNGPSGNKEWVELVVVGTPGCTAQCVDLRGWIIDDNNGTFATGGNQGIADGHMRFANVATWQCVPIGTIIVIYNNADRDALIPPDNTTGANCTYILPATSTLLEHSTTSPTAAGVTTYSGPYLVGGDWATTVLNNTSDSYQTRAPGNTTVPYSAVSYGGNSNNTIIYFAGAGGTTTFFMANTTDNNPLLQTNWSSAAASTATPGAPNNAANDTWIHSMNNNCSPIIPPSVVASPDVTICPGDTIRLFASGSSTGTYQWTNGAGNTDTVLVHPTVTTTYQVYFTNLTGCSDTDTVVVTVRPVTNVTVTTTNATCSVHNGVAYATASGSTGYTYLWNTQPAQSTDTIRNLAAGTYGVTVTDVNGCTASALGNVSQGLTDSVRLTVTQQVSCHGDSNGIVIAVGYAGTPGYTYHWDTNPVQNDSVGDHLSAGTHNVTVTDAAGCIATARVVVSDPPALVTSTINSNASCFGRTDAFVTVQASGGTPAYSYQWNITPSPNNDTIYNVGAGRYFVTVTDANGCIIIDSALVTAPPQLVVNALVTDSTHCGFATGRIVAVASGGTPGYNYQWNTTPVQTDSIANNLPSGTYSVTAADANGCTAASSSQFIPPSTPLSANIGNRDAVCGGANGIAFVAVSVGTPTYFYTWSTSPVQNSDTAVNLLPGTYFVTIVDNAGCRDTLSTTVNTTPPPVFTPTPIGIKCFGQINGIITVVGDTGLVYAFNGSTFDTAHTFNQLAPGTYTIVARDANGCTATQSTTVGGPTQAVDVSVTPDSVGIVRGDQVPLDANATGGTSPYTFSWNPSAGLSCNNCETPIATPTDSVYYIVTATDVNGCLDTAVVHITVRSPFLINFPSGFTPNGDGNNDLFRAITNGPVEEFNLKIFNRWGELVFETDNIKHGWDGKYKGTEQNIETFVWYSQYKQIGGGKYELAKGNITIIK